MDRATIEARRAALVEQQRRVLGEQQAAAQRANELGQLALRGQGAIDELTWLLSQAGEDQPTPGSEATVNGEART